MAIWTTAYINDLPDSAFLYIENGGEKDTEGRTKPRSLRHLPIRDTSGKIDEEHLQNALARLSQVKGLSAEEQASIRAKAEKLLEGTKKSVKSAGSRIVKANTAKRIIYGIVSDPYGSGERGCEVDSQNEWIAPAIVEKMSHQYMKSSRAVDVSHSFKPVAAVVVESWIEPYESHEQYLKAMNNEPHRVLCRKFGDDVLHSGAWVAGIELSPTEWEAYQRGELNAFSIGGLGIHSAATTEIFPDVEFVEV